MPRKSSLTGAASAELNSSLYEDAQEFADQRQEEIVLDHAMAKSSNVGTSEEGTPAAQTPPVDVKPGVNSPLLPEIDLTPARRAPTVDLEDDFFAMTMPVFDEPKKKKKKKKVVKTSKPSTPSFYLPASPTKMSSVSSVASVSPRKKESIPDDADVIVLDDDDEPAPQTTRRKRRLTPPPFDENQFKKNIRDQAMNRLPSTTHEYDPEFNDLEELEFESRMKRMKRLAEKMEVQLPLVTTRSASAEDLGEEPKGPREYKLHVTSFLPGSTDIALDLDITGHKKFAKVTSKILKHLLNSQVSAQEHAEEYVVENVQLLWHDIRITEFMKPDTLNIEEPVDGSATVLDLGLYTRTQVRIIQQERLDEKRRKILQAQREEELDRVAMTQAAAAARVDDDDDRYDEAYREIDQEIAARAAAKGPSASVGGSAGASASAEPEADESAEGYFKIGLKGVDNKKIVVRVNDETKMSKLVAYYLQQKGLPETTKVRLVFDDEDIPLTQTVGDTELEEDFTVEVYLL